MARFLRLREEETKRGKVLGGTPYSSVDYLVSHRNEYSQEKIETFAQMTYLLINYLDKDELEINAGELINMFCRNSCNNFNIADQEMRYIGIGLYPLAALINHSCDPNCVAIFDGREVFIRAIEDIPEGSEISISYIETASSRDQRQSELKSSFFFKCKCNRCSKSLEESKDKYLDSYKCLTINCDGVVIDDGDQLTCQKCKSSRLKEETLEKLSQADKLFQKAEKLRNDGQFTDAKLAFEECFIIRSSVLHKYNASLMNTVDTLMNASIDDKDWKLAKKYGNKLLTLFEFIHKPNWPMTGLQYYLVGRLYWFMKKTPKALEYLLNARKILVLTHGSSSLVRELSLLIEEAEAETRHFL